MPAAIDHPAVREQVRAFYYANGRNLTLAAKTAGVPVDRAEKWKERGKWDEKFDAIAERKQAVGSVGKVAETAATVVSRNCSLARSYLSKAAVNGARAFAKLPGEAFTDPKKAVALRNHTGATAQIGGWDSDKGKTSVEFKILNAGGNVALTVNENTSD